MVELFLLEVFPFFFLFFFLRNSESLRILGPQFLATLLHLRRWSACMRRFTNIILHAYGDGLLRWLPSPAVKKSKTVSFVPTHITRSPYNLGSIAKSISPVHRHTLLLKLSNDASFSPPPVPKNPVFPTRHAARSNHTSLLVSSRLMMFPFLEDGWVRGGVMFCFYPTPHQPRQISRKWEGMTRPPPNSELARCKAPARNAHSV
ncbi:hypothetical protein BCR34DRAFT_198661 [Clohesyomyces aquaticus]|uniref:Uncharacterized protein n=1 Tax=Clohesyomyces aquaticus TaxID=1231657 RepID=A0A1Y1ZXY0_9PLEO|nr:hypothetical protein BCR34DRAFT_198661 [Clohesyomyces aquaticus]